MLKLACMFLPRSCLMSIYYAFFQLISSVIEYWGSANKNKINKLLILQKKCGRLISQAPSFSHCLLLTKNLTILMINDLFIYSIVCLIYPAWNPVFVNQFRKGDTVYRMNTRFAHLNFYLVPCYTDIHRNFIVIKGSTLWNSLFIVIRESCSLHMLKKLRNDFYKSYV